MWQIASDFITFLGWFWQNLGEVWSYVISPVKYVFTFVKSFFLSALTPPIPAEEIWVFPSNVLSVFNAVPYWHTIISVIAISLMLIFSFYIIKQFLKV